MSREKLLSKDPIGAFEKIKDDYKRYFKTMYRFSNADLDDRKNAELERNANLYKELYCELTPKYESSNMTLTQICQNWSEPKPLPNQFDVFINSGLMNYPPYRHQYEMLCKGFGNDENVLITSGTGSGKTESFMLPLFASLLSEAQGWAQSYPAPNYDSAWWSRNSDPNDPNSRYAECQRNGEQRPSALRALLLYPMNALVADQVGRLRKALDSDFVRQFLDNQCSGNRIFFGSYNGKTMKAVDTDKAGHNSHHMLNDIATRSAQLQNAATAGTCDPDDIYVAPRLDANSLTSEMLVREDMQIKAPDIMITNVSMLGIMLMREDEQDMLDQTTNYFRQNPNAKFHLVVDELHLHRGTAGAEVAYLLRMFLDRIGVPPMKNGAPNPQLRIYASSASLGNGLQTQNFLEDFFGVYNTQHTCFTVQRGYDIPLNINPQLSGLDYRKFDAFYLNNQAGIPYYEQNPTEKNQTEQDFLSSCNYNGSFQQFVDDYAPVIYSDLKSLTTNNCTSFALSDISHLNGNPNNDAIRGFLIFRGDASNDILPSIRFHQFYKYVEGLWGELIPDRMRQQLPDGSRQEPIGELSYQPEEVSSNGQHKMLELLRCECCGELFIGGNRKILGHGQTGISLNDPNIDKIPNMQATPMVQRKTLDEYVLFWPSEGQSIGNAQTGRFFTKDPQTGDYEHIGLVNIVGGEGNRTRSEVGNRDKHGAWKEGYLNPFDGSIADFVLQRVRGEYIHGFYYYPRDQRGNMVRQYNNIDLKAMPCKCPKCDKDYRTRKYTQSPIRSFRTGMGRNNQLLSKEILYQLDPNRTHQPKLIGFSDSRQDAAEQSKLIAREHYRDMLRLSFIRTIQDKINATATQDLVNLKMAVCTLLQNPIMQPSMIVPIISANINVSQTEKNALIAIVNSTDPVPNKINNINSYAPTFNVIDLSQMVSMNNTNIDGEIVDRLLRLGINPAGTDLADMYPIDHLYWDQNYDFSSNPNQMKPAAAHTAIGTQTFFNIVYNKLQANIFNNCFGQYMNVNTEAAGLGYVMPSDIANKPNVIALSNALQTYMTTNNLNIEDVLSAIIRVYGDNYRFDGDFDADQMTNYGQFKKPLKKMVMELARLSGLQEMALGQLVNNAMQEIATDADGKLQLNKPLRFKLAHQNDVYYECPQCHRVHLHRGFGFCTNTACRHILPANPAGNVTNLWNDNYISYDVNVEPHNAKRLHSEELTGQTDDQTGRLLQFKDIILDPTAEKKANEIDMLSVTTTMEVGVDIGSLQAIYQGNMPPTRYNYQQRVGRAGRRGQAYSAALTFCRGRSHDNYYYYQAIKEMTGGKPADPTISVNPIVGQSTNLVVLKRIVLKHILMLISARNSYWSTKIGTCGQLGGIRAQQGDWNNDVKPVILAWINNNQADIMNIIRYYVEQFVPIRGQIDQDILDWVNNSALAEMDNAISNSVQGDNAQAITEAGLLPMYGMPISVRNLYHYGDRGRMNNNQFSETYDGTIDRPIEQAISEFAPGAMKTKDGAEYISAGLTVPMDYTPICRNTNDLQLKGSELDPLQYSYNLTLNGENIDSIDDYDAQQVDQQNIFRLVIPKAFRTDRVHRNMGENYGEDDSRSNFMPVSVWVDATSQNQNSIPNGAVKWEVWNGSNQRGDVWYVNLNNNKMFEGDKAYKTVNIPSGSNREYTVETHFFTPLLNATNKPQIASYSPNFMVTHRVGNWVVDPNSHERIAIGAKKITDILSLTLDINSIPRCLSLNANANDGRNKSAIIAAFYSAATLIQRTFADSIDIQPEEIEISEVKIDSTTGLPSVFLNDKAANGAGFISLLTSVDPATGNLRLVDIMNDIVSANPTSKFIRSLQYHHDCKTSCPKCLNTFYNRGLHHVLDWRLGMDVIKLMLDSTYTMGYNDLADTPYGDLANVLNELGNRVQQAHPAGDVSYTANNGHDWRTGFFTSIQDGNTYTEHLVHPLWNTDDQEIQDGCEPQSSFVLERNVKNNPQVTTLTLPNNANPSPAANVQQAPASNQQQNGGYGTLG